ncbi:MAG TPA: protease pro-enzyme activation domain-containing protein, partial [Terracidiphilus sp.]|nr:protease pro-enzyme activation domain-containing protein [Terracidiphilus sp.]
MFSMPWFLAPSSGGAFSICVPRRLKNRSLLLARRASFWILMLTACVAASAQPALQTLSHNVRQEVVSHKAAFVNALPADQQLHLSIVLPLRNQAQLTALLGRLYDPSSPDYRKFLTVDQFAAQFGATASDYQSVVAFAQANGLTVTENHANRLVVPVEGSVAQINQVFNVTMGSYQ